MSHIDVNSFLNLPNLDDIQLDISYIQMPLSLFCKTLGIKENEFFKLERSKNECTRKNC